MASNMCYVNLRFDPDQMQELINLLEQQNKRIELLEKQVKDLMKGEMVVPDDFSLTGKIVVDKVNNIEAYLDGIK